MPFKFRRKDNLTPIKAWVHEKQNKAKDLDIEEAAWQQLLNIASMPFIFKHIAVMPDVHLGKGATVGSVIVTKNAIIPAAVGVECRKTADIIDEIPGAYKDIDDVMKLQEDLVEPIFTLKQILCVKG